MYKDFLKRLNAAVLANTSRPTPDEEEDIKVHKKIMTSLKLEGDSKMGMILFVGIAKEYGISTSRIMDYLGIEFGNEFIHKSSEFNRYMSLPDIQLGERKLTKIPIMGNRTKNKVKLINNYLKIN